MPVFLLNYQKNIRDITYMCVCVYVYWQSAMMQPTLFGLGIDNKLEEIVDWFFTQLGIEGVCYHVFAIPR